MNKVNIKTNVVFLCMHKDIYPVININYEDLIEKINAEEEKGNVINKIICIVNKGNSCFGYPIEFRTEE